MDLTVLSMFCRSTTGGGGCGGFGNAADKLGGIAMRPSQSVTENGSNDAANGWTCAASRISGAGAGGGCTVGATAIAPTLAIVTAAIAAFFPKAFTSKFLSNFYRSQIQATRQTPVEVVAVATNTNPGGGCAWQNLQTEELRVAPAVSSPVSAPAPHRPGDQQHNERDQPRPRAVPMRPACERALQPPGGSQQWILGSTLGLEEAYLVDAVVRDVEPGDHQQRAAEPVDEGHDPPQTVGQRRPAA